MLIRGLLFAFACSCALAQDSAPPDPAASVLSSPSVDEKWNFFLKETVTPLMLVETAPDAVVSQLTRSAPLYGKHFWKRDAFVKRFGATMGDNTSENFFSDFLLASAFHEDTRYRRWGPSHKMWPRIGYAISRAVVTRTDSGSAVFNWANVTGCAMSAALSNVYYPQGSRTASVSAVNWGTNVAGAGLSNLLPEFGSEVGHWVKRRVLRR